VLQQSTTYLRATEYISHDNLPSILTLAPEFLSRARFLKHPRGVPPQKNKFHPRGIPAAPSSIPAVFPRHLWISCGICGIPAQNAAPHQTPAYPACFLLSAMKIPQSLPSCGLPHKKIPIAQKFRVSRIISNFHSERICTQHTVYCVSDRFFTFLCACVYLPR